MSKPRNGTSRQDDPGTDDLVAIFGANLKFARLEMGLTQAQLAEQAGLLQQYVSRLESGKQNVTLTTAQALAKVVGRDVSAMLLPIKSRRRGQRR
jgi:transcriptional regulator with XRE-family HTH domain